MALTMRGPFSNPSCVVTSNMHSNHSIYPQAMVRKLRVLTLPHSHPSLVILIVAIVCTAREIHSVPAVDPHLTKHSPYDGVPFATLSTTVQIENMTPRTCRGCRHVSCCLECQRCCGTPLWHTHTYTVCRLYFS